MSSIDPIVSRSTRECGSAHSIVRLADPPSCSTACTAAHGNAGPQALISAARTLCKLYVHTRRGTKAGQTAFAFKSVRGFSAQTFRSLVTTRVHPFASRATAHSEHTTRRPGMDASSRAQATSGVSALAQLPLVSFLSASPSPSLVLALAPLVDCLAQQPGILASRAQPQPQPTQAVQTPLWDGKAHHLVPSPNPYPVTPAQLQQPGLAPASVYDDAAASPAEGIRGMVEQLNVKTPGRDPRDATTLTAATDDASRPTDYFSLITASTQLPSAAAEASSSAATLVSSTSTLATQVGGKTTPPTPLDVDLAHEDSLFSFTVGENDAEDDDDVLDQLAEALHPVYRNEAWRSIENQRPQRPGPGLRETSSSTLRPYNPAAQHARAEVRRTREQRAADHRRSRGKGKGNSTGASALRQPTAEEDLLIDSLPAAPGFENKPKRLGTVEEEEYQDDLDSRGNRPDFMDTTDDGDDDRGGEEGDDEEFPSASASEVETEIDPDSDAYRFMSPVEQRQLLLFLLELVVESDVLGESGTVTPDPRSAPTSPQIARHGTYSPRGTPSSSTYRDAPRRISASMNRKPVQCVTLGDYDFTATLILTPPPPGAPTQGQPAPSGFIILTTPPPRTPRSPREPMLPQAWPAGTGTGLAARPTAIPLSPDSLFAAGPLTQSGETGHVYEAPSAETIRTVPRARRGSRRNSESEGSLLDADQKWMRALGDGEMAQRIRSHDWSQTSLGPISGWCAELRSGVASILASPFRECILWGEDMAIVYNDLYIATAGDKHPALLGLPAREGWKEIWDGLNSVAQKTLLGETCYFKDHFLAMERLGFVEETCALPCSTCLGTIVGPHARPPTQITHFRMLLSEARMGPFLESSTCQSSEPTSAGVDACEEKWLTVKFPLQIDRHSCRCASVGDGARSRPDDEPRPDGRRLCRDGTPVAWSEPVRLALCHPLHGRANHDKADQARSARRVPVVGEKDGQAELPRRDGDPGGPPLPRTRSDRRHRSADVAAVLVVHVRFNWDRKHRDCDGPARAEWELAGAFQQLKRVDRVAVRDGEPARTDLVMAVRRGVPQAGPGPRRRLGFPRGLARPQPRLVVCSASSRRHSDHDRSGADRSERRSRPRSERHVALRPLARDFQQPDRSSCRYRSLCRSRGRARPSSSR
jgi:hypothetical protein